MDAIKWIEDDLSRQQRTPSILRDLFVFVLISIPVLMGLGMRAGLDDSMSLRLLVPNIMATVLLGYLFKKIFEQHFVLTKNLRLSLGLFLFSIILGTERVFFPITIRTTYSSDAVFFREFLACFFKGGLTGLIAGIYLSIISYTATSLPLRKSRMFIAALSGLSGLLMLGFHCDSSSLAHVAFAHLGAGVSMGLVVYVILELIFIAQLKSRFPSINEKVKNLGRF